MGRISTSCSEIRAKVLQFKWVWVEKLVHNVRLWLAWNIRTLTGRGINLVETFIKREINTVFLPRTKCVGAKTEMELDINFTILIKIDIFD